MASFHAGAAWAGKLTVDFLDVGQGDAILVRCDGKTALIDGGEHGDVVARKLKALKVDRLDLVVATHPHADHIGGLRDVVEKWPIGLYLDDGLVSTTATYEKLMKLVEKKHVPYATARQGMALHLGSDATFTVLFPGDHPINGARSDLNANSVVLRLDHEQVSFLLMGDAEAGTEKALMDADMPLSADVLKVAHHGSSHGTSETFLKQVEPKIAVISVGKANPYGHPADATVERLVAAGARVYRTDESGDLRATSDGHTVAVRPVHLPKEKGS